MATIDAASTNVLVEAERQFAAALKVVLSEVFKDESDLADRYLQALSESSPDERLLALHDDPFDVATALTGLPASGARLALYDELLNTSESGVDHQPPRTSHPITASAVDGALRELGYEKHVGVAGRPFHVWELRDQRRRELPQVLTLSLPQFRAEGLQELVYDRSEILDFIAGLAGDASQSSSRKGTGLLDIFRDLARG